MPGLIHAYILRNRHWAALVAALIMTTNLTSCGSDNESGPPTEPPVPVATVSIDPIPDFIDVGASLALTVKVKAADGTDLDDRPVAWSSDNTALATVTSSGVMTAHSPGVVAIRATSEGRTGLIDARILATAPRPSVEAVLPSSVTVGTAGPLQLRVMGTGFTDRSRIHWNNEDRPTLFINATEVRTTLLASELQSVRTATVSVRTSAPGGGTSNAVAFDVVVVAPAAPTITSLAPAQITAGWALGFTLTITGTAFTPRTQILWDGVPRETQFVSSTSVRMQVSPTDVRTAREVPLAVETPAPGGGRAATVFPVRAIPVDRVDVNAPWGASWLWVNNSLPLIAVPRSATGDQLPDRRATWSSGNPAIAMTVPVSDLSTSVYGISRGVTFVEAVVDGVSVQRPITVHDAPLFDVVFTGDVGEDQYIGLWSPSIGAPPRRLQVDLTAFEPSPSPNGTHIVFSGVPRGSWLGGNVDLYVVARDGSGKRRLTTDEAMDYQPSWSPDGTRIAFTSMRGGSRNVWVMNSDGTGLSRLTDARVGAPQGSGVSAGDASWSPDGSHLVYGVTVGNKVSLWIMDADGANKRPLTVAMEGSAYDPTWSANGQLIAFRREFGNPTQTVLTFVSATDGTTNFPVLTTATMSATPSFSPDGKWLIASNSPIGNVATLFALPVGISGEPRVVLPSVSGGGTRGARWMRRP